MDWIVWPIFAIQGLAIALITLERNKRLFGIRYKTLSIAILVTVCFLIIISLVHDSTSAVNLHF